MSSLVELQNRFFAYLLRGDTAFAADVKEQGSASREVRLAIYGNAYRIRLREVIDNDHPILGLYLGDQLFEQMVADYIDQHPSRYASLRQYGEHLPAFLRQHDSFAPLPLIADLAAFERLLMYAFDAAEAPRASFAELQQLEPAAWPSVRLHFHPSMQVFFTDWNTVESWQALKRETTPPPAEAGLNRCWLIWRGGDNLTEFRSLQPDEQALLQGFLHGDSLGSLCEVLLQWHTETIVPEAVLTMMRSWFDAGLVRSLHTF